MLVNIDVSLEDLFKDIQTSLDWDDFVGELEFYNKRNLIKALLQDSDGKRILREILIP